MAKQQNSRKLFVQPMLTPKIPKGAPYGNPPPSFVSSLSNNKTIAKADAILDTLSPGYKDRVANGAAQAASKYIADRMDGGIGKMNQYAPKSPRDNGSVVFTGSKRISDDNMSYALSKAPNPKQISLNSGIKPNTYSNDYMLPVENSCAPLHCTVSQLQITTQSLNPLNSYFLNTICFDIQTRAQVNIGFALDVTTSLSAANILAAYNAAIYALQVYFHYSSILSYESNPHNKNSGMIALRAGIDATILSDLAQLGRRLEDTPIPPRIVEWVRYMCGNFLSGNSQGAPILKIVPEITNLVGTQPTIGNAAYALNNLNTYSPQFTLIRKSIPNWSIKGLYDCDPLPVYDKNFLTIFANMPSVARNAGNTAAVRPNTVTDYITAIPYNTYHNRLDGLAYSMAGVYNSTLVGWMPGLTVPGPVNNVNLDNRLSYYSVGGVKGFYYVVSYPFLQKSRQDTVTYDGTTSYLPHLFATDKCQNVTGNALTQTAQNSLDYLFDIDSIPYKGKLSNFNNRANGKI